jgi:chemosensory pili system protein ChpA (sensor histidine kinase/response regulator)
LTDVRRGFHTLKGSGRMVGAVEVGDFAWRVEELLNRVLENRQPADATITGAVSLAVATLPELKARLLQQASPLDAGAVSAFSDFFRRLANGEALGLQALHDLLPDAFLAGAREQAPAIAGQPTEPATVAPDQELARLMITEIRQYLTDLDAFVSGAENQPAGQVFDGLLRSVHTLAGTLAMSPLGQEAEVARALEHYLQALDQRQCTATPEAQAALQTCMHRFRQRLFILEDGNATSYPLDDEQLLTTLAALTGAVRTTAPAAPPEQPPEQDAVAAPAEATPAAPPDEVAGTEPAPADGGLAPFADDSGIIAIFLEEATEVLERCDTLLNTWRDKLSDQKLVRNLQREIHTFKGGARMAGLEPLGDLSHAMESLLERIAANRLQATVAAVQALEEGCDRLTVWVEQLLAWRMPEAGDALQRFEQRARSLAVPAARKAARPDRAAVEPAAAPATPSPQPEAPPPQQEPLRQPVAEQAAQPEPQPEVPAKPPAVRPPVAVPSVAAPLQRKREFREVPDRPAADALDDNPNQPHIRVAAELMDSLINHAGEISIYRARLEQQLGGVRFNLKEMEQTIGRLKDQLRKMDMEAEAQMLSRYQHASAKGSTEFDPLELDRFSNMQQLSRSLTESVSDLQNLQEMLGESVRQAETLLVQQSRVSTDLQEGLMQTRMTPFGSAAPRLRRVVRAAAAETGKRARLQLRMAGTSDQLDRNVLERITAPLEHMLRNAVVHGIETPKERRQKGKAEEGEIVVTVEAEATEFIVRVEDDGRGVNFEAVRKRAIERGMIGEQEEVSDARLTEFIIESGFSTSATVTGLAGRGVGMDVVNSEIRQIGGSMDIKTRAGHGTCFTIRIPFSLAVMQAIGVTVGQRPYFVPLNSVSGVARMLPADYAALCASECPEYEFVGEKYPVMELEPLLGEEAPGSRSGNVSLLMIRAGEHKAAFRVTELQSHQEVVMKPVGPQISSIPGILGATISAEGQVVIILDMGPVIRRGLAIAAAPRTSSVPAAKKEQRKPLVMVVDDSITMRKVTSRVLENHALEVMTAQDGLDAIENLHERIPDLMLLDIEMPRMDGYELAEHMRADPRLRHVPIVMITSRAGQKHRKRARDAGANEYMTKPYQEADLVAKVGEMLNLDLQQQRMD